MERKIVHVIGTGTIGEPLIGLLCDYEDKLGIDEITLDLSFFNAEFLWKVIASIPNLSS